LQLYEGLQDENNNEVDVNNNEKVQEEKSHWPARFTGLAVDEEASSEGGQKRLSTNWTCLKSLKKTWADTSKRVENTES